MERIIWHRFRTQEQDEEVPAMADSEVVYGDEERNTNARLMSREEVATHYRVVRSKAWSAEKMESRLNKMARDGWRVVALRGDDIIFEKMQAPEIVVATSLDEDTAGKLQYIGDALIRASQL